mgnify:CR=1 FL=1
MYCIIQNKVVYLYQQNRKTMKKQLINQVVASFKKSLNPNSKWYAQDLADFKARVSQLSVKELQEKAERLGAFYNPNSLLNRTANAEIKRMSKGGMFNVGNMKPENCLD